MHRIIEERNFYEHEYTLASRFNVVLLILFAISLSLNFMQFDRYQNLKSDTNARLMQYEIFYNDVIQKDDEAKI